MKQAGVLIALLVIATGPLAGQGRTRTVCREWLGDLVCETVPVRATVGGGNPVLAGLSAFFDSQNQRDSARTATAGRAANEYGRQWEEIRRSIASTREQDEQRQAQLDLFFLRANAVRAAISDSLRLTGRVDSLFYAETADPLKVLWRANPLATSADMRDVMEPVFARYRQARVRYWQSVRRVATPLINSVMHTPGARNMARDSVGAYFAELSAYSLDVPAEWATRASTLEILKRLPNPNGAVAPNGVAVPKRPSRKT